MNIPELYAIFQKHPVVATDSRNCPAGSIFFALKGDKFDGNDYVEQVLAGGAAFAVCDRKDLRNDKRIITVENTLLVLQALAHYHRKQMSATVIAITGTNGKTTTKELIATALSSQYTTLYTQGNLNNHIGVPLTLLQLKPEHAFAVVELGANHPGEIRTLCEIADPDYGLITNVGKAHLEGFGSFEGVIRTKTELYDFLREKNGTIFCNPDNPFLKDFYHSLSTVSYGISPEAFIHGKISQTAPFLSLEWYKGKEENKITTQLVGGYNLENVLAAICVASHFGVESHKISRAIENYLPQNNRSQNIDTGKNHLIVDAYNANPSSMQAALDNFFSLNVSPKMVVLGEMRELGSYSEEEHRKITDLLSQNRLDKVILVGENFLRLSSLPKEWEVFPETDDLINYLTAANISGYTILLKGSRANQLEKALVCL
jgi:UDP-N-acetylmuramoyl-tripeptide--D-alanyl-D-alanine ligase